MNSMDLHEQIMNLQTPPALTFSGDKSPFIAYKEGHRDARHAAAELALKADAVAHAARRLLDWAEQATEHADCINWHAVNADEGAKLRAALDELVSG